MSYRIDFTPIALSSIAKLKKSAPKKYQKLRDILDELPEHPRTGTGHPEALRGRKSIGYSRHITKWSRVLYDIYEETRSVLILEVEGHYGDK